MPQDRKPKVEARPRAGKGAKRGEEILDTALKLFAQHGYTSVTIKDIARLGNINSALIYYYYHNKEDLFVAAIKHAVTQAMARHGHQATAAETEPGEIIRLWFETNEKLAKPLTQIVRLMLDYRTTKQRSTAIERLITRFYEAELAVLSQAIERGIACGLFRAVNPAQVAAFISAHLDGIVVASAIRSNSNLRKPLQQFQAILFDYLGYRQAATARARGVKLRPVA